MRLLLILFVCLLLSCDAEKASVDTTKPWTYWWWMGSAVDSANIVRQLDGFEAVGIGGAHIIPIYGAKGYETRYKSFLSEDWMRLVQFTVDEAGKRGLGIDMTLGTGWPFGGPWMREESAAKRLRLDRTSATSDFDLQGWLDDHLSKDPAVKFIGCSAQSDTSRIILSLDDEHQLITQLPDWGTWEVTLATMEPTGQQVKRAAPGGEGLVLDYFDRNGFNQYANYFDSIFNRTEWPVAPRALYHDSYETYRSDWTATFPERFEEMHGYDIVPLLSTLNDSKHEGRPALIHDLRATLSELLYQEFATPWTEWTADKGHLSRYQAHGSPGNLLDLYALADIPETESFGCSELGIPGLSCDEDFQPERFGRPSPLTMKFASSPAHLYGKPLVSSETATWLGNHFKVSLRDIKPQIDELFVAGINHIFFHGTTYSPQEEAYPGWLFYASTNFGPSSHFYGELPLLNGYIQRCQQVLQASQPDTDLLLYFPISDLWTQAEGGHLLMLDVHHAEDWFEVTPFGETAALLQEHGYQFDYISDRQLSTLQVTASGQVTMGSGSYQLILLPKMEVIPRETLRYLLDLQKSGASLLFVDQLPRQYTGWQQIDSSLPAETADLPVTGQLLRELEQMGLRRETMADQGLQFIRKKNEQGTCYFVTNLSSKKGDQPMVLTSSEPYVVITDPLTGDRYFASNDELRLDLQPGQSILLQTANEMSDLATWDPPDPIDTIPITSSWEVSFEGLGDEGLQGKYVVDSLTSWTDWPDTLLQYFSGKATYRTSFERPGSSGRYVLQVDQIAETAEIRLNGEPLGTIWSFPNEMEIPAGLLEEQNDLSVVVQNLSANYMRQYDAANPGWKKFYDINFVDITYMPFDASKWDAVPSGLIGEVRLVRLE